MTYRDDLLSIVMPTFKRPAALRRALTSLKDQRVAGLNIEIVVADNDPLASAAETVETLKADFETPIQYVHVPNPGVSNARNGALEAARGRFILFLDDDMEATPGWAQAMMDTSEALDAALVFGPVKAVMPDMDSPVQAYMATLFSRTRRGGDRALEVFYGSGNSLLDRARLVLPSPVFDPDLNQTGGEDDALFRHLQDQDITIAWSSAAVTFEHVPVSRATLKYVWRRNFAFGQSPTKEAADHGWRGVPGVAKWMIVGMVQIGLYGGLAALSRLRGHPSAVQHFGKLAQAVGKVFWTDRLSPKFYGI